MDKVYCRMSEDECVQIARLRLLGIGKFAFETSAFGEEPYVTNMNMPFFDTEARAYSWIEKTGKWIVKS